MLHQPHPSTDQLAEICGEIAGMIRRAWGRGPIKTTAQWAGPNVLVVMLEDGHTDAETTMRAAGRTGEVLGSRRLLSTLLEDELERCVEQITERTVTTSLSATRLDPDLTAHVFLFDAAGPPG